VHPYVPTQFLPQRAKRPCADVDVTSTCEAGSNIHQEGIGGIAGRFVIINVRIPFTAALAVAMLDSRGVVLPSSSFELQGLPIRHPASLSPLLFTHHNANSSLRTFPSIDFILNPHNCFTGGSPLLPPSPPSSPTSTSVHVYSVSLFFHPLYLSRHKTRRKQFLVASFTARVAH
jgi:hypothetical protein